MESPVVKKTFSRRQTDRSAKLAFYWFLVNIVLAVAMFWEVSHQSISVYFSLTHPIFWYTECGLALLFTVNVLVDLIRYLSNSLGSVLVEMTPKQRILLGIKPSELGFKTVSPTQVKTPEKSPTNIISPSHYTPYSSTAPMSFMTPGSYPSPGYQYGSSGGSVSPASSQGTLGRLSTSDYHQGGSFLNQSYPGSAHKDSQSPSFSASFSKTPSGSGIKPVYLASSSPFNDGNVSGLRSRFHSPSPSRSILAEEDNITGEASLRRYLQDEQEKEYKKHLVSPENMTTGSASFWNYNQTAADFSPVLAKYQYQIASRSLQSTKSSDPDDPSTHRGDEVWLKLGVHPEQVDKWIENLRKWMSQTVMVRLAKEINVANEKLAQLGAEDTQIGEVSVATLKQLAITKGQQVPTLNSIIPFLEVSADQEYLTHRIQDLGQGGCMSDYRWNKGVAYKRKTWGEHLPTDSAVVMHVFCTYMDSRLPPHPKFPDGKTFTSQHFIKTPDKPNLKKTDTLQLYQCKINPPHYKVVIGEEIWDVPKGRNCLFQAILLFLYHIKTKEHGMLGRINLGMSGVNILWVLAEEA